MAGGAAGVQLPAPDSPGCPHTRTALATHARFRLFSCKLGLSPTRGRASSLSWSWGSRSFWEASLCRDRPEGRSVTQERAPHKLQSQPREGGGPDPLGSWIQDSVTGLLAATAAPSPQAERHMEKEAGLGAGRGGWTQTPWFQCLEVATSEELLHPECVWAGCLPLAP